MTIAAEPRQTQNVADDLQHIVLHDVSWSGYESLLREIGDGHTHVSYNNGMMEIMAPLSKHEHEKVAISRLLELMCFERRIPLRGFGSTTFRRADRAVGLEPDECYYVANEGRAVGMDDFDPSIYPAPDLAIEIDITRRSVSREPIYAALGVPELWRYDGTDLKIMILQPNGQYAQHARSEAFPFLPVSDFLVFVKRMRAEDQLTVLREFQSWVSTLE